MQKEKRKKLARSRKRKVCSVRTIVARETTTLSVFRIHVSQDHLYTPKREGGYAAATLQTNSRSREQPENCVTGIRGSAQTKL